MKLRDIINMPLVRLKELTRGELSKAYRQVVKSVESKVKGFESKGLADVLPKVAKDIPNAPTPRNISELSNFLLSNKSNVNKYIQHEKAMMKTIEERLSSEDYDFEFESLEEYQDYKRFLGAMAERVGENWKYVSGEGMELYAEAKRLNLNPNQFLRNANYWIEHVEELTEAKPLSRKTIRPSDYARQLKLPKIRGGGNYGD